ncbi:Hypothetical protein D9617_3g022920 [Elsinoe fawcettii]|nr:Hypothetical protein D9617_3g022920 [Elsinoe fawcettii]
MPSSSSGTTSAERTLRSLHATIIAHLYYHTHTSSLAIPYKFSVSLYDIDTTIPKKIHFLFARVLDIPEPDTLSTHSNDSSPLLTDDNSFEIPYHSLSSESLADLNDIAGNRPTPQAVLDSLAVWIEKLAQVLEQKGRHKESKEAWSLLGAVKDWTDKVRDAMEELGREHEGLARGLEGVVLRWGV